ncbi:2-oxo acid dehydrogenase subunit E2 [Caldibacillus thermolactis]|uniref:Dihydrolipoamide acetyltransferase component of pyruvate dehydrogenase complex n=1 Tax=Pallidibacillus thermolactis TaxID=251051 RepID=A0ABT2WLB1_9BACI|nr:dihydrolipoamide acetyltransferase family protein [Pallidibacillus thermolactis]MCU9594782.1 2-oxo acid dehydrogenase subunit E2 [Pallidibacillus thermolactis]
MIAVKLHDIGEGMTEGEILKYYVKPGDYVKADQPLLEVQTDKMVAELPAPTEGTVKEIIIKEGTTVEVGTTLLYIEAKKKEIQNKQVVSVANEKIKTEIKEMVPFEQKQIFYTPHRRVLATPYTRKIARDNNINIEEVPASDPSGRVTEEDVYRYIEQKRNSTKTIPQKTKSLSNEETIQQTSLIEEIALNPIRKKISKKMTKSIFTIPHVTSFDEINMTKLMNMRKELKDSGYSISVAAFLIKALVIALKDFPVFNAELDDKNEKLHVKKYYNIGIAVDTTEGLLVPVIHNADKKSIQFIHDEIKRLNEQARNGKLKIDDMKDSTFTVSNVGPLGSTGATPIINYPETALIAFHKTKKMPIVSKNDEIIVAQMMNVSLSFDHRVADGATAVNFINRFKELVEEPNILLLELI